MNQPDLFSRPEVLEVPDHRVHTLASVIAGFQWPARGSFEKLTKPQKQIALDAARECLETLARADADLRSKGDK